MQNRLKELRKEKKLSLVAIEKQTGIKRSTFSDYENGKTEPKLATWQKLADFFDVDVGYLQGITTIKNYDVAGDNLSNLYSVKNKNDDLILETLDNWGVATGSIATYKEFEPGYYEESDQKPDDLHKVRIGSLLEFLYLNISMASEESPESLDRLLVDVYRSLEKYEK
ncbi:Transcriptional regulator [Fructobacillus fructosus]|uniref:helix-turn-helix domain-containing protein n=1 Tax=Fructobacillus fructosus TaxID=1631 RepID=UPI002DA228AF|nr:Transcriptional regulator [Fructobacillus fructosus]CAK1249566.1 Transcriptional regulator [Fructobacillus fructosus]